MSPNGFIPLDLGKIVSSVVGMVADNTTQTAATPIIAQYSVFTSVVSSGAAKLPSSNASEVELVIYNEDLTNSLIIWPSLGDEIIRYGVHMGVNVPVSILPGLSASFACFDGPMARTRQWRVR